MLPQGWIVLHKEEEGLSFQRRAIWRSCYMCEWWEFVPYASVCVCEVIVQEHGDDDDDDDGGRWAVWSSESRQARLSGRTQARLSLSMWKVSLRAGPSFKPMYFIIMSLRSNRRALPSISWRGRKEGRRGRFWCNGRTKTPHTQNKKWWVDTHVFSEEICVRSQHRVDISDVLHDFLHRPQVGVLAARLWALTETAWKSRDINEPMNEWIKKKKYINKHLLDIKTC